MPTTYPGPQKFAFPAWRQPEWRRQADLLARVDALRKSYCPKVAYQRRRSIETAHAAAFMADPDLDFSILPTDAHDAVGALFGGRFDAPEKAVKESGFFSVARRLDERKAERRVIPARVVRRFGLAKDGCQAWLYALWFGTDEGHPMSFWLTKGGAQ